jgi:hypothetical protein
MSQGEEMETYEAAYRELLSSPVPQEGLPLSPVVRRTEMSRPTLQNDDPYERLVRELDTVPLRWLL